MSNAADTNNMLKYIVKSELLKNKLANLPENGCSIKFIKTTTNSKKLKPVKFIEPFSLLSLASTHQRIKAFDKFKENIDTKNIDVVSIIDKIPYCDVVKCAVYKGNRTKPTIFADRLPILYINECLKVCRSESSIYFQHILIL
jgi:hypothetical protein